jgi:phosphoglycolate phosphatase
MRYKALIFDLDGTLLDTLKDLAGAGNRVLSSMGLPTHPVSAYRIFVGDGMQTLLTRILPENKRTRAVIEEAIDRFREDYSLNWQVDTASYDGIEEMLDKLVSMGCLMSILSNKPDEFTRICVDQLLPQWKFWPTLGQRADIPKKPDPHGALEITRTLNVEPSQILFVGDTSVDMQTASNAGMDAVGVLWGFRTADELRDNGARYLIQHPSELPAIVQP